MVADRIPEEVKRFIEENIDSVELLEVLLLLRNDSKREWSVDSVSSEIRSNPISVAKRLGNLCVRQLISKKESSPSLYYYNPGTDILDQSVKGLADAYARHHTRVIELIFSKQTNTLRSFSDAFKFRKEDENG